MSEAPSLFYRSIAHALGSWPALAACVRHGAGGTDSAAKAEWLIGATEQWLTENHGVEPDELADFYKDIFWEEFDTIVEDGSLILVASTICGYQTKIKRGLKAEVEESIREAPKVNNNVSIAPDDDDDDEEDDHGNHGHNVSGGSGLNGTVGGSRSNSDNAEEMEVDEGGENTAEEEEEGWTTVKKGGKKRR